MSQIRYIYTIQTNGEETPTPVAVQSNRILKIDEVGASIMLGDTVRIVRGRDLYIPPDDVAHGIMFGTDKKKLCKAWDTAVKKKAMSILNSYSRFFTAHEDIDGPEGDSRPASSLEVEQITQTEQPVEKAPMDASSSGPEEETENNPSALPIYPHACKVSWNSIDAFIPKMVAKWFPDKDSQISARAIFGNYAESNDSWTFILEEANDGDRSALAALLAEHDVLHQISLDSEWPKGEPLGSVTFPLTTAISNHILATEFLPFMTPPFTFGVNLSIPNVEGLILVSNAITD